MSQIHVDALHSESGSNSNIELDNSRNTTCKGNLTVDGNIAVTGTGLTDTKSFRNLIINGAMQVAQRGTSSTTNGYGSVDRWKINFAGTDEAITHAQHALTSSDTGPWAKGFRNSLHLTNGNQTGGAAAGDYSQIVQKIEAQDLANSGWEYTSASSNITISFWVKASVAQTFYCNLETSDGTAQLYSFSTGALSADTWTKITKTIPGNSNVAINDDNGIGLILIINQFLGTTYTTSGHTLNQWAAAGSYGDMAPDMTSTWWTTNDATFEITGVQLEVGDSATDFEHMPFGPMKQRCLRYFWKNDFTHYSHLYHSGGTMMQIRHPVEMRARPTVTITGDSMSTWTNGDGDPSDTTKCYRGYVTATTSKSWTSSSFDAEL